MLPSCAAKLCFCQRCSETMDHCPWCRSVLRGELSDLTTSSGGLTQHERLYEERMSLWSARTTPEDAPETRAHPGDASGKSYSLVEYQEWALSLGKPASYGIFLWRQAGGDNLSHSDFIRNHYSGSLTTRCLGHENAEPIPLPDVDREVCAAGAPCKFRHNGGSTPMTMTPRTGTFSAAAPQNSQYCETFSEQSVDDALGVAVADFDGSEYEAADLCHSSYLSFQRDEKLRRLLVPADTDPAGWAYGQVYHVDGGQRTIVEGWFPPAFWRPSVR